MWSGFKVIFPNGGSFLDRKTVVFRKMTSQKDFPGVLEHLDLGPLRVKVEPVEDTPDRVDAVLQIHWAGSRDYDERRGRGEAGHWGQGESIGWFEVEFRQGRSLRDVRNAAWSLRDSLPHVPPDSRVHRILVMPYLNRASLGLLREMGVNGLDLCGNGVLQVGERWFYQHGSPNRYSARRSRAPYRGKSALVARALLLRPEYGSVGEVREEIERRGGSVSMGQVSKVLSALEDDLVIRKRGHEVRLLQPKKLLDALVDAYKTPVATSTLEAKAELDPGFLRHLRERAQRAGARIVGVDPQRYVIAPQSRDRLEVYVEPGVGDLTDAFDLEPVSRFATLAVHAVAEPGVYFDPVVDGGFEWVPPLEVYLQLMQGGKREQEIASNLRPSILDTHSL